LSRIEKLVWRDDTAEVGGLVVVVVGWALLRMGVREQGARARVWCVHRGGRKCQKRVIFKASELMGGGGAEGKKTLSLWSARITWMVARSASSQESLNSRLREKRHGNVIIYEPRATVGIVGPVAGLY